MTKVEIYTWKTCPFCLKAKALLDTKGVKYIEHSVDGDEKARDEMAARARGVEARLSDALHARLTERFVNRRTTILMKSLGQDASALPVTLEADGQMTVEGEPIGKLDGFFFGIDLLNRGAQKHFIGSDLRS